MTSALAKSQGLPQGHAASGAVTGQVPRGRPAFTVFHKGNHGEPGKKPLENPRKPVVLHVLEHCGFPEFHVSFFVFGVVEAFCV